MSKTKLATIIGIVGMVAIIAVSLPLTQARADSCCPKKSDQECKKNIKKCGTEKASHCKKMKQHLPAVSQAVDKAINALKSGDKKTALAQLQKAQKMLAAINKAIAECKKSKFANTRCPIMGSAINPDKVTKDLIRDYKGQKIAFCCGGCPSKWDKLTNAEKNAKLVKFTQSPKTWPKQKVN